MKCLTLGGNRGLVGASAICAAAVRPVSMMMVVVAPLVRGCDGALVLEKECGGCWNVYDAGLRGWDASMPPCVAAVCPLLMAGDARPDVVRRSMAMVPLHLGCPLVGC